MRIDLYTKAVLTVIGLCLLWQCLHQAPPARAASELPTNVVITGVHVKDTSDVLPVGVVGPAVRAINGWDIPAGAIEVKTQRP